VTAAGGAARFRWLVLSVFVLSTTINYLDRQTLTMLAPLLREQFHLSNTEFGWIVAAFSLTYAVGAPFAGVLTDRIGLNRAISIAVGIWSCAGMATGFTRGLGGLVGCRAVLGLAEAGGIPAAGKAIHHYLLPAERALGNAINNAGVNLGLVLAAPIATFLAIRGSWRTAFVITGLLGLAWIPLWKLAVRAAPAPAAPKIERSGATVLEDRRIWAFMAANGLSMVGYSLWTNWTALYLVEVHHLSLVQAAWYAWIPPVFGTAGGLAGGWLSLRFVGRGLAALSARFRVCLAAAALALATAGLPLSPTPAIACGVISISILAVMAFSVNMYSMPLDAFGGARAAFAVSLLVCSYGAVQALLSPIFGKVIDVYGFAPVAYIAAVTPLAACGVLWGTRSVR
jgi:ACS family hexuronate transporter-like MFS transporter